MKLYDISLTISTEIIVYPEDPKPKFTKYEEPDEENSFHTTLIEFLSHTGTHVDAPSHLLPKGTTIDEMPLKNLVGEALVIDTSRPELMTTKNVRKNSPLKEKIVLLKTGEGGNLKKGIFNEHYLAPGRELAEWLVKQEIKAIGIDTLSIDRFDITEVESHPIFLEAQIPIIEGLYLEEVTTGTYFCVCLPLKLKGLDGSPARVILIEGI
ncbi:MAG: cyclase family protein [Candidatus Hodarchaeales archaeon]